MASLNARAAIQRRVLAALAHLLLNRVLYWQCQNDSTTVIHGIIEAVVMPVRLSKSKGRRSED